MAQNLAESEAVRYAQKWRDRGRTPSLPASSHYSISRPATPSGRTGQQQASPFPPTERGRSNIEIMVSSGPTDSTSQESGTRPPFNRPPPTEWGRRVESQRERNEALERGEETDIPDQGVTFIDGYPYDYRLLREEVNVKQESTRPSSPQGLRMTGIQLSLPKRPHFMGHKLTTPLSQVHYPGRLNPESDPLLGDQSERRPMRSPSPLARNRRPGYSTTSRSPSPPARRTTTRPTPARTRPTAYTRHTHNPSGSNAVTPRRGGGNTQQPTNGPAVPQPYPPQLRAP